MASNNICGRCGRYADRPLVKVLCPECADEEQQGAGQEERWQERAVAFSRWLAANDPDPSQLSIFQIAVFFQRWLAEEGK